MNKVRLNILLPQKLVKEIEIIAGPRKRSQFIAEAIERLLVDIKERKLHKFMAEGYRLRKAESLLITQDFANADLEGWDEY